MSPPTFLVFALSETILVALVQLLVMLSRAVQLIFVLIRYKKKPNVFISTVLLSGFSLLVSDVGVTATVIVGGFLRIS